MSALYTSAIQRLKELAVTGPFFSVAEMGTFFKLPRTDVHQMLHRWTKNGLAEPIGPRAGVYLNTLHPNHQGALESAIQSVHPSAIVIGHQVLYEAGVTTQIPPAVDVVVQKRGPAITGYRIHQVSPAMYAGLAGKAMHQPGRLARLPARLAAETAKNLHCLLLDPDDMEWSVIEPRKGSKARQARAAAG